MVNPCFRTFYQTFVDIQPALIVAYNYSLSGSSTRFPTILKPDVMAPGSLVLGASIPTRTTNTSYINFSNRTLSKLFTSFSYSGKFYGEDDEAFKLNLTRASWLRCWDHAQLHDKDVHYCLLIEQKRRLNRDLRLEVESRGYVS